ncbi:ABC transporter substrate-binding protein [Amycolatopsis jejuensis]|uniref:ABC transporter substrate-binding protein n=1 Tax=Amycolatopsis jejuensis TaxID=330084 RepID=UPI000524B25A|nr:ABC transporter substrate-binding protein [Amycolatopsis jejuensis]
MEQPSGVSRRQFLRYSSVVAGGLAVPSLLSACGDAAGSKGYKGHELKSTSLVLADYGGVVRTASEKAMYAPFTKETGIGISYAENDVAKLRLMAEKKRTVWDISVLDGFDLYPLIQAGLVQKLPDWVTRNDLVPDWARDYATGQNAYSICQGYRTDRLTGPRPESWADFFDVKKIPGKRTMPSNVPFGAPEMALLADGVPRDKIYPLDLDRAYAKLDELKPHLLFGDSYAACQQFLQAGSVSLAMIPNGRFTDLASKGIPAEIVWNEALLFPWSATAVPVGAPHTDAAMALNDFMAQPEPQAELAKLIPYGPNNSKALGLLPPDVLKRLPNSPDNARIAFTIDEAELGKIQVEYTARFHKWIAG